MSDKLITVLVADSDFFDGNVQDVIDRLSSFLELVPEEFRSRAVVSVEGVNEYGWVRVVMSYMRPKTEEDIAQEEWSECELRKQRIGRLEAKIAKLKEMIAK